jgi:hypothetical protein
MMRSRDLFFVFVRILFKCFDEEHIDICARMEAKKIVRECIQRNRLGLAGYKNLMASIETRLNDLVGETSAWHNAELYLESYNRRAGLTGPRQITPTSSENDLVM